jgi:hypothetical protein
MLADGREVRAQGEFALRTGAIFTAPDEQAAGTRDPIRPMVERMELRRR